MNCTYCGTSTTRDFSILRDNVEVKQTLDEVRGNLQDLCQNGIQVKCGYDFIEHISANPVGPMHLGNLFNSLKGDLLCRILNLTPSYYVNDLGNNYCKLLVNHQRDLQIPLTQIYSSADPTLSQIWAMKKSIYQGSIISPLRDLNLKIILDQLNEFKIVKPKFYYQTNYIPGIRELIKLGEVRQKGIYYKGHQVGTSNGLPLYITGDLVYHQAIDEIYERKLVVLSKDHSKYVKDLNQLTGKSWDCLFSPLLRFKGKKLSKRSSNVIYLTDLLKLLKENTSQTSTSNLIRYIKLYLLKYQKRQILNVQEILEQSSMINLFLNLQPIQNSLGSKQSILNEIRNLGEEDLLCPLLSIWTRINYIMHNIVSRRDLNKLYKLLEYLHFLLKKNEGQKVKSIHNFLLMSLFTRLGL